MLSTVTDEAIDKAVQFLHEGRLIGLPTETVYGLGVDACNTDAVASLFRAKGRPANNPLITHVSGITMAARYAKITPLAQQLAEQYWPGALTIVLERLKNCTLTSCVSAHGNTIALRVPKHPVAQRVIGRFDGGIAAPSANRSGRISPTRASHVHAELGNDVALILDAGPCVIGIESTVIDARDEVPVILRAGSVIETSWEYQGAANTLAESTPMLSPGQLSSHYAPTLPVRINATDIYSEEAGIGFGATALPVYYNLSKNGNLEEAACNLYAMLRLADNPSKYKSIAIMPIPNNGVGVAINDRITRAAVKREEEQEYNGAAHSTMGA